MGAVTFDGVIAVVSVTQGEGHGAEVVLENLLRGRGRAAEPVTLLCPPQSRVARVAGECGQPFLPLGPHDRLWANFRSVAKVGRDLRGCRLVHAWTARGFESALWLGVRLGVPATATLHDHPRAGFHGWGRRWLMRAAGSRMAGIVGVSRAVEEACRDAGWKVPMTVVRNGLVDRPRRAAPAPQGVRVGFLGMYTRWKGFSVVEPWIRRTAGQPGVCWRLYGDVAEDVAAAAAALAQDFPDRVLVEGRCAPGDIFDAIDVLVHASTAFDPLPTVLIEAARAGIPAVASRRGGAAEIVVDGETGMLFDVATPAAGLEGLERLLGDGELRRRLGAAARAKYEREFTIGAMVAGYQAFWGGIAAR